MYFLNETKAIKSTYYFLIKQDIILNKQVFLPSNSTILVDDKINDLERLIRLSSNDSLSKEITDSVKPFFQEYGEYIKKRFHYFRENHKTGETKRSISNLTSSYIQKCREILEPE